MREVWLVPRDKKLTAENLLKKDEVTNRQSIFIKDAKALGFEEEGFFIIMDGADKGIAKAKELLKDMAKTYPKKEEVLKKFDAEEEAAAAGFGALLGD